MLTTSLTIFRRQIRFALFPFRSLLIRISLICFLFLPVLRCFNSRRSFPSQDNSEILGSKLACSSPKLIAACHVLRQNQNQAIRLTVLVVHLQCVCYLEFLKFHLANPFAYLIEHENNFAVFFDFLFRCCGVISPTASDGNHEAIFLPCGTFSN